MFYSNGVWSAVIDSGVGGLTILRQLQSKFPHCNYLYLADSANCPYGTKSQQQVYSRIDTILTFLRSCGASSAVIACNTASVHADKLRQQYDFPIYDVITPTCQHVATVTSTKRVALLATNATVESGAYQRQLSDYGIDTVVFKCSSFVPFVESNNVFSVECRSTVCNVLANLPQCNVDTVVLGCTHFPILRKQIAPYVYGATIVECQCNFELANLRCDGLLGQTVYFTTGNVNSANTAAQWFGNVNFKHIDI